MIIKFNNVLSTVEFESPQDEKAYLDVVKSNTVTAPGAQYMRSYKVWKKTKGKQGWDGQVRIIGKDQFLTGLLPFVLTNIVGHGISLQDDRNIPSGIKLNPPSVQLRSYQRAAYNAALSNQFNSLWWPRGVIEVATGGGKTEIAVAIYQATMVPTLFIVHRKDIVEQTIKRFAKYGISAGKVASGVFRPNPNGITVATMQTVASILRKHNLTRLSKLTHVEQVFFDEAHLIAASIAKGNLFVHISKLLPHAYLRWGLTATPFMKDNYSDRLLEGATGDSLYKIKNADLIRLGYLVPPIVKIIDVPEVPVEKKAWPDCYDSGVVLNTARTKLIISAIKDVPKPCFIMCNQVAHAEIIQRHAKLAGLNCEILTGKDSLKKRQTVLSGMAQGKIDSTICTTIFDEGLDLPELRSLILAGGGKSRIKQLQKIGRGLRTAPGKDRIVVVDFNDTSTWILKEHSRRRRKVWKEEGFEIQWHYNPTMK